MNRFVTALLLGAVVLSGCAVSAQSDAAAAADASTFTPFQQWMGAVLTGDAATLKGLYSTTPPAQVRLKTVMHPGDLDSTFWLDQKVRSMKVEIVRLIVRPSRANVIFRADVVPGVPNGQPFSVTDDQTWMKQGDQWHLVYIERTDAPKLKQPSDMKKDLYPPDVDAHAEIREAEQKAARSHKRLLLVFGANWCFDCHVLDLAFHGPELAPIIDANYVVVHVDIGPDGKKNGDIAQQFDVSLDKGVPTLAIVASDGKVIVSEKNGEFEDARQLTPEFLAEFLNKWKPQAGS
jgi:thioredoxin 1